jgi:hypothetical protein
VGVAETVAVGEGVADAVGVQLGVIVKVGDGVALKEGVLVGVREGVFDGVAVDVNVRVKLGVPEGVLEGVAVGVKLGVNVLVKVGVKVRVKVEVLVGVKEGVKVAVGVEPGTISMASTLGLSALPALNWMTICPPTGGRVSNTLSTAVRAAPASANISKFTRTGAPLMDTLKTLWPAPEKSVSENLRVTL